MSNFLGECVTYVKLKLAKEITVYINVELKQIELNGKYLRVWNLYWDCGVILIE